MKAGFVAAIIAAFVASAIAVVPAFSTGSRSSQASATIGARVKALEKKVKVLQTQVKVVQARLKADEACANTVAPAAQFNGYFYTPDGGVTVGLTTAVDFTATGETPQVYLQLINSQCVSGSSASRYSVTHLRPLTRNLGR